MTEVEIVTECEACQTEFDDSDDTRECSVCNNQFCESCESQHAIDHCFDDQDAVARGKKK